jgi:site-specific DNA-methyltransferase (cytosine-N4-specific)
MVHWEMKERDSSRRIDGFSSSDVVYTTLSGAQLCGDSRDLLECLPDNSIDLIVTSPPFALLRKKSYGNEDQDEYVAWLSEFGKRSMRVLKDTGSLVLDLGGSYQRGVPVRSLYNYRVLLEFVDNLGFYLAEEFFWYNPAKLPSPVEWVNKRKIRVTDAVNTVWWLSKTTTPASDVTRVLVPYSGAMKKLLEDPESYYDVAERPSEHSITRKFGTDNGGAIPKNLLTIANTGSNSLYQRACRSLGVQSHPARFPEALPEFFIRMLTDPGDMVLDIFGGSNTTGAVAERLNRRWLSFEMSREYCALSAVRFMDTFRSGRMRDVYQLLLAGGRFDFGEILSESEQVSD